MRKRVVFLMSDTGGGHRAAAEAIGEALLHFHGDSVQVELVDLLVDHAYWPLNRAPRMYRHLVDRYTGLWQLLLEAGERPWLWRGVAAASLAWHRSRLRRFCDTHPADLLVSVHPLLNHVPRRAMAQWMPGARFATVVTDLTTAPSVWFDPAVDLLCASCAAVQAKALAAGIAADRIRLLGLPVRSQFTQPAASRPDLRRQLGLPDLPTVLVVGGGEGMGPVEAIARTLGVALAGQDAQMVVVCGRNAALRDRLQNLAYPGPVRVEGFVANMAQWMRAADCLVTKAGPGTIAEALVCGLPLVLSGYVPGQETGNVAYVLDHGVGVYKPDPVEIAATVRRWLAPGSAELARMRQRAHDLARPHAALNITEALSELL